MADLEDILSIALGAGKQQIQADDPYLGLATTADDIGSIFTKSAASPELMSRKNATRDAILGAAISGLFGGAMTGLSSDYQTDRMGKYNNLLTQAMAGRDVTSSDDVTRALAQTAQNSANIFNSQMRLSDATELRKILFGAKAAGLNAEASERGKLKAFDPVDGEVSSITASLLNPRNQEARKIAEKARGEVSTSPLSKAFSDLKPNFDTMIKTYEFNDKPSTLAFVSSFARLLDPGSVVREGEIKNAENTQSFLTQLGYNLTSLVNGTQSLSPETKQQMARAAAAKFNQFGADYTSNIERQRELVGRLGGDPSQVFGDIEFQPFDFDNWAKTVQQKTLEQQLNPTEATQAIDKVTALQSILEKIKDPNLSAQEKARLTGQARMIAKGQ